MKAIGYLILFLMLAESAFAYDSSPVGYWKLENLERYVYPSEMEHLSWKEIRFQREQRKTANMDTKVLTLSPLGQAGFEKDPVVTVSILDPDGKITETHGSTVTLPEDKNLIGRYLIASTVRLKPVSGDSPNGEYPVVLCSKGLVSHYKNGGRMGKTSRVFWDDPGRLPLEIGPVLDTAKSRFGGGIQMTHREYEMMVKFKKRPLQNAVVTVSALDSGWVNTLKTDDRGIFVVMPTDDRVSDRDFQTYLYTATHPDRENGLVYMATLPVTIYKNRPEWRSKAMGFIYWAICGTGLTLLLIAGYRKRKAWEDKRSLAIFENHTIKPL